MKFLTGIKILWAILHLIPLYLKHAYLVWGEVWSEFSCRNFCNPRSLTRPVHRKSVCLECGREWKTPW